MLVDIDISKISISFAETHHVMDGKPLYSKRFDTVMSFHKPGIAAVKDNTGAYHIDFEANPTYLHRYKKSFGYYGDLAAVVDDTGWFHINTTGTPIYEERYAWVGNFQEGRCPVRDSEGKYFHITSDGDRAYPQSYRYTGDFKYGIGVVYGDDGYAHHIDQHGNQVHSKRFLELGVYHKGYAIARDSDGYFHIDKKGESLYDQRYEWIEPSYNDFALIKDHNGEVHRISIDGKQVESILSDKNPSVQMMQRSSLMDMLVGYWQTQIIYSIVKLGIMDLIDQGQNTFGKLKSKLDQNFDGRPLPQKSLKMIINVMKIWNLISIYDEIYSLTYKGKLLCENHPHRLKYAALMWGNEHYSAMGQLTDALITGEEQFSKIYGLGLFEYFNDQTHATIYHNAMTEYTLDYKNLVSSLPLDGKKSVIDIGGGKGSLLREVLIQNPSIQEGYLFEMPQVINEIGTPFESVNQRIIPVSGDFFSETLPSCDAYLMSRVIHDWNDLKATMILKNIQKSMPDNGTLILIEMIMPDEITQDFGVTLNFNLLVTVGGQERTLVEFNNLLSSSGFKISQVIPSDGIVSAIIAQKMGYKI